MKRIGRSVIPAAVLIPCLWLMVWAGEDQPASRQADAAPPAVAPTPPPTPTPEPPKDFPELDKVITKDFEKQRVITTDDRPGLFTLFYNTKTDEILVQIPQGKLSQEFMIATTIVGGTDFAGWQWGSQLVRFERRDKKLLVIEPDVLNEGKKGKEISEAVKRTYTDRVLKTLTIKTLSGQDPVIDLGELFKIDYSGVGKVFGGGLDTSLARYTKFKMFPENTSITVESPFSGGGNLVSVNYNISAIPQTTYKSRVADDRVGYFLTVRRDWGKDYKAKTLFNRYINRWNLEKLDPTLEKSPPKEPIIFYIEKTVPVRFRKMAKEGILEWNKAFEKIGFVDAVQVRQQTEDNEFKDFDPEDVRYNFFRWSTAGNGIAVGPSRANPYTGQIYDADVVFDDSWIRYPIESHAVLGPKSWADEISDPMLCAFLKAHPEFNRTSRTENLLPGYGHELTQSPSLQPDFNLLPEQIKHRLCNHGECMRSELNWMYSVIEAQGYKEIPNEYIDAVVKDVVTHEIGHTLGLRHNFKASGWLPLDEILNKSDPNRPISASVMDYNAFMFNLTKETQHDYVMTTIGPYDYWAIEYGYRPVSESCKTEEEVLKSVMTRAGEKGLEYATDEDTSMLDPDPLVNRRDMGDDQVAFAKYRCELADHLLKDITSWAVDDDESYSRLRNRFNRLLNEKAFAANFAGRYVGGASFNRVHKGETNAKDPFVPMPAEKQREAMKFLSENIFSETPFLFDPAVLNKLAPGRWGHWESDDYDWSLDYNLQDHVEGIMGIGLFTVFNPFTINRLHDMELRYPADQQPYTVAEHIRTLTATVWSELDKPVPTTPSDAQPFIHSFRRALQRMYAETMESFVTGSPGYFMPADVNALMRMTCEQLHDKIAKISISTAIDDASRAHLQDVQKRFRKSLDAQKVQDSSLW